MQGSLSPLNVLSESEPTQEFIAPEETKASGTIQTPTPVIEAENYHPMVSFAPLVEALEPAVVAIEVEATQAGMERNPLLEQFWDATRGIRTPNRAGRRQRLHH